MAKRAQDLQAKRELAMKVNDIVHWDFDVKARKFESYNESRQRLCCRSTGVHK